MSTVPRLPASRGLRLVVAAAILAVPGCASSPPVDAGTQDRRPAAVVTVPLLLPGTVSVPESGSPGAPAGPALATATLDEIRKMVAMRTATPPRPPAPGAIDTVEATRRYVRGRAAVAEGKLLLAASHFRRALEADPSSAAILEELGRTLGRLGDAAGAAECHERLLVLRPDDPEALFSSGVAAAARGDLPKAIERLATLHELSPSERDRGLAGFRPEARTLADLALGRALATLGADAATVAVLAKAADEASPDVPDVVRGDLDLALGDALARTGDLPKAAIAWERAAVIPAVADLALPRRLWSAVRLEQAATAVGMLAARVREHGAGDEEVALAAWFARMRPAEAERLAGEVTDRRLAAALRGDARGERPSRGGFGPNESATASRESLRELFASLEPRAAIERAMQRLAAHPAQAEACAAALVRSGATAGGLLAALDQVGDRPGRGVLEPALAAALGDEARLARVAEAVGQGAGGVEEIAATAAAIARLGEESQVELLANRLAATEGLSAVRRAAILASLSEAARGAGDAPRARELADAALSTHRDPTTLAAVVRLRLDAALSRPEPARGEMLAEAIPLIEEATADPAAPEPVWRLRIAVVDALGKPALRASVRDEARRRLPGTALDRQLVRDEIVQAGRVAEALDRAAIRASAAPTDLDAFRFVVAGVPRTGQGERLRPWLVERQLRMPAETDSLEALVAFLLASGGEEAAFELLRRRAEAEPPEPFASSLLERALVERGRAREAWEMARSRPTAGIATRRVRDALRFAALSFEAGEPTSAAETLSRLAEERGRLSPGAALAAVRLAERLPADLAGRDAIVRELALAAVRETAPERLEASLVLARLAARSFGRSGSEADRKELARAVSLVAAAASAESWDEAAVAAVLDSAQRLADDEELIGAAEMLAIVVREDPAMPAPVAGRLAVAACALAAVAGDRWERSLELVRLVRSRGARPFSREGDPAETEAEAIHRLSGLHSFLDDRIGADRLLEQALAREPDHVMSLNNLAYSAIDRGEIGSETVRLAERAHELVPDDPSILDTLGWLRYKQGRFRDDASGPGAVTLLSRSIRARPDDPGLEPLDHLGDALWRAGDRDAAIRAWKAAAELLPVRHPMEATVTRLPEYEREEQGIRLLEPRDFWQRSYGDIGERAARKAATALAGGDPAVAPLANPAPGT